jgi:hypothetical protein
MELAVAMMADERPSAHASGSATGRWRTDRIVVGLEQSMNARQILRCWDQLKDFSPNGRLSFGSADFVAKSFWRPIVVSGSARVASSWGKAPAVNCSSLKGILRHERGLCRRPFNSFVMQRLTHLDECKDRFDEVCRRVNWLTPMRARARFSMPHVALRRPQDRFLSVTRSLEPGRRLGHMDSGKATIPGAAEGFFAQAAPLAWGCGSSPNETSGSLNGINIGLFTRQNREATRAEGSATRRGLELETPQGRCSAYSTAAQKARNCIETRCKREQDAGLVLLRLLQLFEQPNQILPTPC